MGERASLATSNPPSTPGLITAEDMRYGIAAGYTPAGLVTARSGFRPASTDPGKVTASGTADKFVHVSAFQRIHQSTRSGGTYVMTLDATEDINVLDTQPAHVSGITKHLIIAQQNDIQFGEPDSEMRIRLVLGAAGTNTDPSLAAYPDHVLLARLNISANVTTVTTAMIEDLRPATSRWTVSSGGVLPIESVTERDAIANPYSGLVIYRRDRHWFEAHDGTAWRVQGTAICTSTADRDSAITHPKSGQLAVTTDNDTLWQYDGATSAWICMAAKGVTKRGNRATASAGTAVDVTDIAVLRVSSVRLLAGRLYKVWTSPLALDSTVSNDEVGARIRFTTNSTNAVASSPILPGSNVTTRQTDQNVPDQRAISAVYAPSVDMFASFVLCVRRIAGTGTCTIANNAAEGDAIDLVIEDIGTDPGDSGTDLP